MTAPAGAAPPPFTSEFLYWISLDFAGSEPADLARFERFYNETHVPEVLSRYPGFRVAHRFSLQIPDPRGDFGGGYLAAYEVEDEQAVEKYIAGTTAPGGTRPPYSDDPPLWPDLLTHRWRVVYEKVSETGPSTGDPGSIYIIGIEPPADVGDELAEFDEFYTGVHLPEAVAIGGFSRGSRYTLRRELEHPAPGCPRFLAVYEQADGSDEQARATLRTLIDSDGWTPGPASWTRKTTPWRLWYRHIAVIPRATSPDQATVRQP
ncbi:MULTISPECIES: DUF4286 family protein [Actinomadura]|uniref:EthD domain-containing protein n=1 Tax=Actinomadura litoris TaxID=2678616 RepID=A0A7K1KSC5_9ACTN|nr:MULTISPECIES: DUF4286 family protein [Actinomadura]MBT2208076.1 hypothetical protein [Actinomadura sp. NEAU-AAG7]MUN35081.1 hypothetical protein [Actinomadura litoris]